MRKTSRIPDLDRTLYPDIGRLWSIIRPVILIVSDETNERAFGEKGIIVDAAWVGQGMVCNALYLTASGKFINLDIEAIDAETIMYEWQQNDWDLVGTIKSKVIEAIQSKAAEILCELSAKQPGSKSINYLSRLIEALAQLANFFTTSKVPA